MPVAMAPGSSNGTAEPATQRLVELGLAPNEARCYVALLERGPLTAAGVAEATGVPRPKVYGALQALEGRGFCAAGGERVLTYRPVGPELALAEWLHRREDERHAAALRDATLREELVRLLPAPAEPAAVRVEVMEALVGRERTADNFERMVRAAARRLDVVQAVPFTQEPERWNRLEVEAVARGVQVRVLFTPDAAAIPGRVDGLLEGGVQARVSDALALKLVLLEGTEAMVALRDPKRFEGGVTSVAIRHPDLVAPLQLMFQREWRRATPLPTTTRSGRVRG
jgi:sugar-specific transcriptional regulator TrmB